MGVSVGGNRIKYSIKYVILNGSSPHNCVHLYDCHL